MSDYVVVAASIAFSFLLSGNMVAGARGRLFASPAHMRVYVLWFRTGLLGFLVLPACAVRECARPGIEPFERGALALIALTSLGFAALLPAVKRAQIDRSLAAWAEDLFRSDAGVGRQSDTDA